MNAELLRRTIIERYGTFGRFAAECRIGKDCLSRIVNGQREPGHETLKKLMLGLLESGVSRDEVDAIFFADVVAKMQRKTGTE